METRNNSAGTVMLPQTPLGTYTAECVVHNTVVDEILDQLLTPDTCRKTIENNKTIPTCESLVGDRTCLAQDGCYYDEKTSKCTSTVLTCEDAVDAGDDIFTK